MRLDNIGILVFAYNRPSHLKRVLIAIEDYKITSDIILIIDGPKNKKDKVNQQNILAMANRFKKKNFKVISRKKNLGLSKSIISGISFFSKKYKGIIVLEDDVVPYRSFFQFVSYFFEEYSKRRELSAICGYQFHNFYRSRSAKLGSVLLPNFTPWGWAISAEKWKEYERSDRKSKFYKTSKIPSFFKKYLNKRFYARKKRDLWTLDFIYNNYLNNKFYVYPNFSLVKNIGFDGTGINSKVTDIFNVLDKYINTIDKKNYFLLNKKLVKKQDNFFKKNIKYFY